MNISVIMIAVSIGLLAFWFRYTCRLILSAKSARDYSQEVAVANALRFLDVQKDLPEARERRQLDTLQKKLEKDYLLLRYLLHHGPVFHTLSERLEQRMLMLDFELLKAVYAVTSELSHANAKRAVQEMTQVVSYFANRMGERSACALSVPIAG